MRKYQPKSPDALKRELRAIKAACEESNKPQIYINKVRQDYECTTVKFCKTNGTPKFPNQTAAEAIEERNRNERHELIWLESDEEHIEHLNCIPLFTIEENGYTYQYFGWL
jgi:hypothetical protein